MKKLTLESILFKIRYYSLRPLTYIYLYSSRLSKPGFLEKAQWKVLISIYNKHNCESFLEFGSGRSTIYFVQKTKSKIFLSINPISEMKYTNIVREKFELLNIKNSNIQIINSDVKKKEINSKTSVNYDFPFLSNYDLIFIDGPSKKINETDLIYNILNGSIKSKIIFIDGRQEMVIEIKALLKKKLIKFEIKDSVLLNYTYFKIN